MLYKYTIWLFLFMGVWTLRAQQLSEVKIDFDSACVSSTFNNFRVEFSWAAPLPSPTNQYIIELSDANGNFDNSEMKVLETITGRNTSLRITTTVQFPNTLYGSAYRIRVRSTNPSSSVVSTPFEGYFINVNSPLVLNNGVSTLSLCPGHPQTISVDKTTEKGYRWYKDNVLISDQKGPSLTVTEAGVYYAVVDYGSYCSTSSGSRSNNVTVTSTGSSMGLTISGSPADGYICSGSSYTMTANIIGSSYTYNWYKDNVLQSAESGVGKSSYTAPAGSAAGTYYVEISSGAGGACSERSNSIEVRLRDDFTATASASGGNNIILPGGTKELVVTSTAPSATYQWFRKPSTTPIAGATSASYAATQAGTYYAKVTSTGSCVATVDTNDVELVLPTNFNVSIGHKTGYDDCLYDKATLEVKSITAVSGTGSGATTYTLAPADYALFSYVWYNGTTASTLSTAREIVLPNASSNGTYTLQLSATGYTAIPRSNSLNVRLLDASYIQLNNGDGSLKFCSASSMLTASVQNPTALYTWYKDDVEIHSGTGEFTYEITTSGRYHVSVTIQGECPATSNYVVAERQETVAAWVNPTQTIDFFSYKTYVLNITHNMTTPTIVWYSGGTTVIPNESGTSYTVTQKGTYHARLTDMGGCNLAISTPTKYFVEPSSFIATIGYKQNQSACGGTEAVLELQKLQAVRSDGTNTVIDIPTDEYQYYTFQWIRGGNPVAGETSQEITVQNPGNNTSAEYQLQVGYNTLITQSDPLTVTFVSIPDVSITTTGAPVLCQGGSVVLSSSLTSQSYTYKWYRNLTEELQGETGTTLTVNTPGEYHVEVTFGGCSKKSEGVSVQNFSPNVVTVDKDITRVITITGTDGVEVTASGADSYLWTAPDGSVVSTNALVTLRQTGIYTLVANVGACSTTLQIEANEVIISEVPNVVTPNGDGYNDVWAIPDTYAFRSNVKVSIYSQEGKMEFSDFNYQNNWPTATDFDSKLTDKSKRALIYLYIIEVDGKVKEQGTISVFR